MTVFADRADAGRRLVGPVADLGEREPIVLGIARGGVLVADALAEGLHVACDVAVVRKVGAPGNPEVALGAVAPGVAILDHEALALLGLREADLRGALEEAVLVDDGIATGSTAIAAIRWARAAGASRVVLEVPASFGAVGEWYRDFGQASDEDVLAALGRAAA
ncbi:MAG: phosphoribosyltransferase family protein [Actinomycetota bacterium]